MKSHRIAIIFLSLLIGNIGYSQALKGRAKVMYSESEDSEERAMKYGNVEAYDKDGKLVASVLTDELGNYAINFKDTGMYEVKIMYAGYKPITQSVHVEGDEVGDFSLKRDESKKVRKAPPPAPIVDMVTAADGYSGTYSWSTGGVKDVGLGVVMNGRSIGVTLPSVIPGTGTRKTGTGLTSGEINDFAKWDLWNDMVVKDLAIHQKTWRLDPQQRYVVQLMNEQKSPMVGAIVSLISKNNITLWLAITDNTGKAELWGALGTTLSEVSHIIVEHEGETERIGNPSMAKNGINSLVLDAPCDTKNIVDIAFVIDATGSMSDEINFIKSDLNSVIYNSQNIYQDVALRYASVFYRDKGDAYVTKHKDFTNVLSEALVFIDEQSANGGGDAPEAVDKGLEVALEQLSWSEEARSRILFLVLDAEAHSDPETVERIKTLATEAASRGIKIVPVAASGINKSGEYLMRALALCTNGKYVFLTDHSGIGISHIEPTTDEYEVELLSERLTTIIKNNMFYPACEETIPDFDLNYPDSLVQYPYLHVDNVYDGDSIARIDSLLANIDSLERADSLEVSIDSLQVDNPIERIEWKFYPNPTQDIVNIETSENVDLIYLTDLSGKLLQEVSFKLDRKKSISLASYPSGIYLLRYPVGKHWVTGKIVLSR